MLQPYLWVISVVSFCFASHINLNLELNTASAFGIVDDTLASVAFEVEPIEGVGILTLDLESEEMRALVRGLSPYVMRVGGSNAANVFYSADGSECVKKGIQESLCLTNRKWHSIVSFAEATGGRLLWDLGARDRETPSSPLRLDNIRALFAAAVQRTSCTVPLRGPSDTAPGSGRGGGLMGFEVSNEVDGIVPPEVLAHDFAAIAQLAEEVWGADAFLASGGASSHAVDDGDVAHARLNGSSRTVRSVSAHDSRSVKTSKCVPLLAGPASHLNAVWAQRFLTTLSNIDMPPGIDVAITFHHYYAYGKDGDLASKVVDTTWLRGYAEAAVPMIGATARAAAGPLSRGRKVYTWVGEAAAAWGGGASGVTDRTRDIYWYTTAIASMAAVGVSTYVRQLAIWNTTSGRGGATYALIGGYPSVPPAHEYHYFPQPDYWIALAFTQLVGDSVADVKQLGVGGATHGADSPVLTFGFSSRRYPSNVAAGRYGAGAVIVVVNPTNASVVATLSSSPLLTAPRCEYIFTPGPYTSGGRLQDPVANGDLKGDTLYLNGATTPLMHPRGSAVQELKGVWVMKSDSETLSIPPYAVAFYELPNATLYGSEG